jgi:hypothetical protein
MKQRGKVVWLVLLAGALAAAWLGLRASRPSPAAPPVELSAADAEELQLMNGAEAALASGDSERAFSLLYEHATKFPKGQLASLRQVVHIETLCRVGKAAEARQEMPEFLARNPSLPLVTRARGSCASSR